MARQSAFRAFLAEFRVKCRKPVSEVQLAKAEKKLGVKLPSGLRKHYGACDGGRAEDDRSALHLFSLTEALDYGRVPGFLNSFWGYLPVAENNDSNPICVCCKSPLAGYVVQVNHDDAPQLKYRSLDGLFEGAVEFVRKGEFLDTHELPSEFARPQRTKRDGSIARRLIDTATKGQTLQDQERSDALRFACDLLSDADVEEMGRLLKVEDEYVREHVLSRLKRAGGAKAKKVLGQFEGDYDAFVERCARTLQREGIQASVQAPHGKEEVRIDPWPIWLNMDVFYAERKRPALDAFLLERARFFIADEKKQRKKGGGRG